MVQQLVETSLGTLLWDDPAPLEARHEKAARALVSVQQSLANDRPLGGEEEEFLALFA